jgi:myo-inositol-1(or 4)-monophosphatase
MSEYLEVCEKAARLGGKVLLDWAGRFATREKAPADLVTDADLASQEAIRKFLLGTYPTHDFLGEEGGVSPKVASPYRWIVDPLDGTTNYVHQFPNYCVSIALEHAGEMLVGVVFDPTTNECYKASRGGGAWLNDKRLSVSAIDDVSKALVAVSFPNKVTKGSPDIDDFVEVLIAAQATRRLGSAALNLCYLAAGRFDGYWATNTKIWDVAAALLIVREAGGLFTDIDGAPFRPDRPSFLSASTKRLHDQLRELLGRSRWQ